MIEEVGPEKYLEHLADPFWFQALTCALGFDHKSSGATTVTCAALKKALAESKEIGVCGGKGDVSLHTPEEISEWAYANDVPETTEAHLCYVSRMTAKVDSPRYRTDTDYIIMPYFLITITTGLWSHKGWRTKGI